MNFLIKHLAHRGFTTTTAENSKTSFDLAYFNNFDGVELDLHLTKDNEIVIIHDEDTFRTTLEYYEISNSTLEELKTLNIDNYYNSHLQEKIMTLNEFLILYSNKFSLINFEIKTNIKRYLGIEKKIYELIQPYKKYWKNFIFSSFNFESLTILKNIDKNLQCAYLIDDNKDFKTISKNELLKICSFLNPKYSLFKIFEKEYKKLNLKYIVWDVNTVEELKTILSNNLLFAIISNNKLF